MAANRIKLASTSTISTLTTSPFTKAASPSTSQSLPVHSSFVPIHYEKNYQYPLIVWLHSEGDDQQQLQQVMPLISVRNFVAVGPRGTVAGSGGEPGYDWWQNERDIFAAESSVLECVESARLRYNIARHRIFIAGFSHGGTMAMRLGLRHPELFAGAVTIGGAFPQEHCPLNNLLDSRSTPILMAHGRDSDDESVERTCGDLRLLHAGGFNVTLRQYPCGHELTTQMLSDMNAWIMEQVTGQSADSTQNPQIQPGELN